MALISKRAFYEAMLDGDRDFTVEDLITGNDDHLPHLPGVLDDWHGLRWGAEELLQYESADALFADEVGLTSRQRAALRAFMSWLIETYDAKLGLTYDNMCDRFELALEALGEDDD